MKISERLSALPEIEMLLEIQRQILRRLQEPRTQKSEISLLETYLRFVRTLIIVLLSSTLALSACAIVGGELDQSDSVVAAPLEEGFYRAFGRFTGVIETDVARSLQLEIADRDAFPYEILCISVSNDGRVVYTMGDDWGAGGTLVFWNPVTRETSQLIDHPVYNSVISLDGRFVMYADRTDGDPTLHNIQVRYEVMDLSEQELDYQFPDDDRRYRGWSSAGYILFSNTDSFFYFDPEKQQEQLIFTQDQLPDRSDTIDSIQVFPVIGGQFFYMYSQSGRVYLFDKGAQTFELLVSSPYRGTYVSVSPDGRYIFYGDSSGETILHERLTGEEWLIPGRDATYFLSNTVVEVIGEHNQAEVSRLQPFDQVERVAFPH